MPWLFNPQVRMISRMEKHTDNQYIKALAARVKEVRLACNISQEQLALVANVDRSFISRLERGIANPSFLMLVQIANALGQPTKELIPN